MLGLALAAAVATQAAPADTPQARDLRCIAVISQAIGTRPAEEQSALIPLATYYVGRATGRDPSVDLEGELRKLLSNEAEFQKMVPAESKRCGAEMTGVGKTLQRIGDALKAAPGAANK